MFKRVVILFFCAISLWGGGRLYYKVTHGFTESKIRYDFPFQVSHELIEVTTEVDQALSQNYYYLGKGCQSYVFESQDHKYVIKFLKCHRYRPQRWLELFTWLPAVETYYQNRNTHKYNRIKALMIGWKTAYDELQPETGVVYVKLTTQPHLKRSLVYFDKVGFRHETNLDETPFLLQRKATMLCSALEAHLEQNDQLAAQQLLESLLQLYLSEYERGYADSDCAIMQNTGVINGRPIHIDVGQFKFDPAIYEPAVWKQDLFNKTYRFGKWLHATDKSLSAYLTRRLVEIIGDEFHDMICTDK